MRRNNGRPCGCGRQGCLETYASATGVARTAREYLEIRKDESLLRDLDPDEITSKDVFDAAMKNDKLALEIFELQEISWVKLLLMLLHSPARKPLFCSVVLPRQAI